MVNGLLSIVYRLFKYSAGAKMIILLSVGYSDNSGLDEIIFYGRYEHWGDQTVTYTYAWDGQIYKQVKEEISQ